MTSTDYVRLRQICLASLDIAEAEKTLTSILNLKVCHRSTLDQFGLENILLPIGAVFIEIVAPTRADTAVHRFLAKNDGKGGYMAIFDCSDVDKHRTLAAEKGVSPVYERKNDKADLLQLNPKQTGATMMEFDHHYGGDNLMGNYEWAGDGWQEAIDRTVARKVLGLEIISPKAEKRAKLWAHLCDRPLSEGEKGVHELKLDLGVLTFRQNSNSQQEILRQVDISVENRLDVLRIAEAEGCPVTDTSFEFCGVMFRLHAA
ncbi:MAG: VOC family protein [Proteobacteria bacterium]|nr:VOC family protein [Pseudomonadota bacterium]